MDCRPYSYHITYHWLSRLLHGYQIILLGRHRCRHSSLLWRFLPLATAPSMWQLRGPGTACRLVSRRRHLCPHSGASSRHYFLPEAILTASTSHDKTCRPVPRIPSFRLTLLGVLAIIVTLRHLNEFFDEWLNEYTMVWTTFPMS